MFIWWLTCCWLDGCFWRRRGSWPKPWGLPLDKWQVKMRLSGWWWDHLLLLNVSRRHLSITASELSVSPNRGHKEKKQGHHESPPPPPPPGGPPSCLSSSISSSSSPPLLPPPLSSYIPGALFFAGKCSPTTGGEVELFSGINGRSAPSKLPQCSYLPRAPSHLQLLCLLCSVPAIGEVPTKWDMTQSLPDIQLRDQLYIQKA